MSVCPHCHHELPQLDLADLLADQGPKHRTRDRSTAKQAAAANEPRRGSQRARLLEALVEAGQNGATADELSAILDLPYVSASTRCSELIRGGWAVPTTATRKTRAGGDAEVLLASSKAVGLLEKAAA